MYGHQAMWNAVADILFIENLRIKILDKKIPRLHYYSRSVVEMIYTNIFFQIDILPIYYFAYQPYRSEN